MTFFYILPVFPKSYSPWSACFSSVALTTLTGNSINTIHSLLWRPLWPGSCMRISQGMFCFENSSFIVSVHYTFKLFRNTSCISYRYKTEWLNLLLQTVTFLISVDNWINKPNGIGTKLQVMSQNVNFVTVVLGLLHMVVDMWYRLCATPLFTCSG